MIKFLLIVSFLAISEAALWRIDPMKKGNDGAKGLDQAGPNDPAQLIIGALSYLFESMESLNGRVGELEGLVQDIEATLSGQGGQEPGPDGSVNQEPSTDGAEPVRSDKRVVPLLIRKLESRLNEKSSEQKLFK
ncbi:hypothetical protein ACJMK2_003846 [Sinanodonta woodiana]|uniref:Uncharacterized protein n=1 Tax=Sinanodonta woodiana TaxID=1069815 RepID=A0ABD3XZE8_SINWO